MSRPDSAQACQINKGPPYYPYLPALAAGSWGAEAPRSIMNTNIQNKSILLFILLCLLFFYVLLRCH